MIDYVTINENGLRIGQDHPKAVLSDSEVEALINDRGDEDAPLMSYSQLAKKWGISKSSVRDILIGRRRGQAKKSVKRPGTNHAPQKKVRLRVSVSLHARAMLHRVGASQLIDALAKRVDYEMRCVPGMPAEEVIKRVLEKLQPKESRAPGPVVRAPLREKC